jgi:hypothetical protein
MRTHGHPRTWADLALTISATEIALVVALPLPTRRTQPVLWGVQVAARVGEKDATRRAANLELLLERGDDRLHFAVGCHDDGPLRARVFVPLGPR